MIVLVFRFLSKAGISSLKYDELLVAFDLIVGSKESEAVRSRVASLQFVVKMCAERFDTNAGPMFRSARYLTNFLRALWTQASQVFYYVALLF